MNTYYGLDRMKLDHPDEQVEDAGDGAALDVEDAFGEHNIEYWVRKGNRLVPATEAEIAQHQEWEREREVMWRLTRLKEVGSLDRRWSRRLLRSLRAVRFWQSPVARSAAQASASRQHS